MPTVYVGTSLFNSDQAKSVMDRFRGHGVSISYDWTTHGQVFSESELEQYGIAEINGVTSADLFFMIPPARSGTHVELGAAIVSNKPVVLILEPTTELKTFYFVPNVFRFSSVDEAFTFALEKLKA